MFFPVIFSLNTYIIFLLGLVSIVGDYIVSHTKLHLFQALFDNTTHSLIGALSWFYVCLNFKNHSNLQSLAEIGFCAIVASLIDLDHFIVAKSIHLKDATSLQKRPPLHCTTIPIVLCTILIILSYVLQSEMLKKVSLISLTGFLSHHTRDATRRGFWFFPFGSTSPIPYCLYVFLTCALPAFVCVLHKEIKIESRFSFSSKGSVI